MLNFLKWVASNQRHPAVVFAAFMLFVIWILSHFAMLDLSMIWWALVTAIAVPAVVLVFSYWMDDTK